MVRRVILGTAASIVLLAVVLLSLSRYQTSTPMANAPKKSYSARLGPSVPAQTHRPSAVAGPIEDNTGRQVGTEDIKKIQTLKEILKSKNDNDPRLDTDFKELSENTKRLMRQEYKALRPESFNEKGTIVFLLGRNLTSAQDFDFMAEVLSEPPCYNIEDCSKPAPKPNHQFADEESLNGVTTAYPQIVSLKNLEDFASREDVSPALKDLALRDLKLATASKNPRISKLAQNALYNLNHSGKAF